MNIKTIMILAAMVALPSAGFSQEANGDTNPLTADNIIDNYIKNTGGSENWKKVKVMKSKGNVESNGIKIPYEIVQSASETYTKLTVAGKEIKNNVFDGKTLWSTNPRTMEPEKNDNQEDVANIKSVLAEFPDPFINYKEKGFTVELMGKQQTVDGKKAFKIKLTKKPIHIDGKKLITFQLTILTLKHFFQLSLLKQLHLDLRRV